MTEVGRVFIAFDDGPLEITPTWTPLDQAGDFPDQFVAGYDTTNGRQTLLAQTDTGTGTVYINDHKYGLFDPRNSSSPYYQKLDGRQILFQLYDPVRDVWEPQFQGTIENTSYDIDGSAVNANGEPINASIQINCVDFFDYAAGFGLTPGLAGVRPVNGGADGVWYAQTQDEVRARIIEILSDITSPDWVAARAVVFSGNVDIQAVKYDPDESALVALRDACDAEFPFIANMYVDRYGRFVFHGRYGRFQPDDVAADAGPSRWNFHRWPVGDGAAIAGDSTRAQMRVLGITKGRDGIVNVAVCFPMNMQPAQMPDQVYADTTSITDFGHRAAPPMSDLLTARPVNDNLNGHPSWTRYTECFKFAELLVKNQKDPHVAVTAMNLKSLAPNDPRAAVTWPMLTQVDVSDIVNVKVGYPGGTGLTGASPADDHFVEGRHLRVRPLQPGYDYVELDLELSPFAWSADTHGVFPIRDSGPTEPVLTAAFAVAL